MSYVIDGPAVTPADSLFNTLPHTIVLEYLPISSILLCRETCLALAEAADGLLPRVCASLLNCEMMKRNIHLVTSWGANGVVEGLDEVVDALLVPNVGGHRIEEERGDAVRTLKGTGQHADASCSSSGSAVTTTEPKKPPLNMTSAFDRLLRCLRVMRCLPHEVLVAFNGKYGRHCLPISLESGEAFSYPSCQRGPSCATCHFRIPPSSRVEQHGSDDVDENSENEVNINDYVQIRGRGGNIDLTRFYNTCAPNLPPDLVCPQCHASSRTLVLGQVSYRSSGGGNPFERRHLLTYTPGDQRGSNSDSEEGLGGHMTPRHDAEDSELVFPPLFSETPMNTSGNMGSPGMGRSGAKYAISIHCFKCRKFGILSPVGRCTFGRQVRSSLVCTANVPDSMVDVVPGANFVRTRCGNMSNSGCLHPVPCVSCAKLLSDYVCKNCISRFCEKCSVERCEEAKRYGVPTKSLPCTSCKKSRRKRRRINEEEVRENTRSNEEKVTKSYLGSRHKFRMGPANFSNDENNESPSDNENSYGFNNDSPEEYDDFAEDEDTRERGDYY